MGPQLRGFLIGIDTDGKCLVKGEVSVEEVHEPKVRGASANPTKSCT